ncbi:MAG TPA: RNA polymerase sigma-54 factor [Nitrospirales bacterium]|nr:RNA polymerase sigma-54 factor [Nitrospirales bacterium]
MKLQMDMRLSQRLVMTPQLQQAIKLLQMSRLELEQTVSEHLMENPLLEEVEGESVSTEDDISPTSLNPIAQSIDWQGWSGIRQSRYTAPEDSVPYNQRIATETTLEEHLLWQLNLSALTEDEKSIARLIIGNIDERGYLCCPLEDIATDTSMSSDRVGVVLRHVQGFDPPGVAARDLRECLLIQAESLGLTHSLVWTIIDRYLSHLERKNYKAITKAVGVGLHEISHAVRIIEGMEPRPGRPFYNVDNQAIIPDVIVVRFEGKWHVLRNDEGLPRIRIQPEYKALVGKGPVESEATQTYLGEKMRSARWLVRSLDQRNKTIIRVAESILKFQEPFFSKGRAYLKPLVLKQVADDVSMHESTVSRVTANKFLYSPHGIFRLKYFFSGSIARTGNEMPDVTPGAVREMIRNMIAEEDADHPLGDQEVVNRLDRQKVALARRTVAKYRAELRIAPANQRKRAF